MAHTKKIAHITKKGRIMNPLSLEPGGATLVVETANGLQETVYRIKVPRAYVKKLHSLLGSDLVSVYNVTDNVVEYPKEKR
jgi:hypothetical protein